MLAPGGRFAEEGAGSIESRGRGGGPAGRRRRNRLFVTVIFGVAEAGGVETAEAIEDQVADFGALSTL